MHRFLMTKKEEKMTSALLLFKSSTVGVQNLHSRIGDLSALSNLGITVFKKSHSRIGVLYEQEVGIKIMTGKPKETTALSLRELRDSERTAREPAWDLLEPSASG